MNHLRSLFISTRYKVLGLFIGRKEKPAHINYYVKRIFGKNLWNIEPPAKSGGNFSIYYGEKHVANVRGKIKAKALIDALHGKDSTDALYKKF